MYSEEHFFSYKNLFLSRNKDTSCVKVALLLGNWVNMSPPQNNTQHIV